MSSNNNNTLDSEDNLLGSKDKKPKKKTNQSNSNENLNQKNSLLFSKINWKLLLIIIYIF